MSYSQIAAFDVLRNATAANIAASPGLAYIALGSAFIHLARLICISNNTKGDMFIAITSGGTPASDGTTDNIFIPAGGFKLIDVTTNRVEQQSSVLVFAIGTQVWVRQSTAGVSSAVYLEVLYGIGET